MTDNTKIIQDICLLYELSLSVGSSLDAHENCKQFLYTLISRKSLNFASVWIHKGDLEDGHCELFFITPSHRADKTILSCSHPTLRELVKKPYLTISSNDPGFENAVAEKNVGKGSFALFRLGTIGFLKLFSKNKQKGFGPIEMAQLKNVVDKFAISLQGCLAHSQLKEETAIRQITHARLTNLITNLQAGVLLENEKREIVLTNLHFCEMFNIPVAPDMLVGQDCSHATEQSKHFFVDPERFVERIDQLLKGKKIVVGEILEMADGRILERDYIPLLSNNKSLGHQWQYRDVTEARQAQKAILESEEKYRGIIENMELGLLEVDTKHTILRPYKHFCEMLGYTAEELMGQNALELLVSRGFFEKMREQDELREKGKPGVYEVQLMKKDGSLIWAIISGAPIKDKNGNVVGSIGVHYDITARKKLETALADAKRAAEHARLAERQFLANMSHEIRTPMSTVIGMTHLLYETGPTPVQKEYFDSLRFSANSLMGIIDNVLDLSKIEAGELGFENKSFDLGQLLKSLQRTFQFKVRDKAISVTLNIDPNIQNLVVGDPTRLNQILTNLLGNASKFTDRGTIGLQAKLLQSTGERYQIEFRVQDTGTGIDKDKLDTVFQNFKQGDIKVARKYGGTGLGLTIVKQLVELQGGAIRVESQPGKGSDFIFTLTFLDSGVRVNVKEIETLPNHDNARQLLKNLNILIVEDNVMNQRLISKMLEIWGCLFELAQNGLDAVARSQSKKFDLILMDIHMPEMDGVEAARLIRSNNQNPNQQTPIIALTAAALLEEKNKAIGAGMNDFLTRPFSPAMLEKCMLLSLDGQGGSPAILPQKKPIDKSLTVSVDLHYLFDLSNGDRLFVLDMLNTFLLEIPGLQKDLHRHLGDENWENVYKTIHVLKSNFMMFGMNAQEEKAIEAEVLLKSGAIEKKRITEITFWLAESIGRAIPILEMKMAQL